MDIQLPGANGFELTRRLSRIRYARHIVVALTAYASGDKETAQTVGCTDTSQNQWILGRSRPREIVLGKQTGHPTAFEAVITMT